MTIPAHVALAASLVLGVSEVERIEDVHPVVDIRRHLHPKQLEVFECDAPAMNVLGGRQGGKTFELGAWMFEGAFESPGTLSVYFALTQKSARHIMWVEIKSIAALIGLDPSCLNDHTMTVTLPNGSRILCTGTDDTRTIETWRGVKLNRVGIDEMGAQPAAFVEYFVAMLWPTLIKNRGRMQRTGNPGQLLKGYWFDQTGPARTVDVPLFHWTAWDNPALGSPEDVDAFVDAALHDAGVSRDSVTFKREWMAQWTEDRSVLVYPYDERTNGCERLPTVNRNGYPLAKAKWRHVVVVDPAAVGITGVAVMANHPDLRGSFVLATERHRGMMLDQLIARCRALKAQYPAALFMMDAGGLGSTHAQEFSRKFGFYIEPAKKTERKSAVRWTHDGIISGHIKILDGECNDAWREEALLCGWNDDHDDHEDGAEDHTLDCVIYGERKLREYVRDEPLPDTRDATKREEDRILRARTARYQPKPGRPSWSRIG